MIQPAWNKTNKVSKTKEISKTNKINKYSDGSNFWNYLFNEYEIFPLINCDITYTKRKINLKFQKRNININYQKRKIDLLYE
ncbi:MAG: hypothetical protein ACOCRK_01305 [bacterium]